jgi:AcrR family transcriptional regulator
MTPRPDKLTRERIVTAALDLIEAEGLAAFSTRALASRLGCKAMSIYHWFPSKAHLMDALVDQVIGELPEPDLRGDWLAAVRDQAVNWRRMALKRPEFFPFLALHRLNTPRALAFLDRMIALMASGGLDEEQAVRMFRSLGYYLVGTGLDETAGYSRGPSTAEPVPDAILARDFPHVAGAARFFRPEEREATFLAGLEVILEGWERRRRQASARANQA